VFAVSNNGSGVVTTGDVAVYVVVVGVGGVVAGVVADVGGVWW